HHDAAYPLPRGSTTQPSMTSSATVTWRANRGGRTRLACKLCTCPSLAAFKTPPWVSPSAHEKKPPSRQGRLFPLPPSLPLPLFLRCSFFPVLPCRRGHDVVAAFAFRARGQL